MWYKIATQGRVINRIENLEKILKDAINNSIRLFRGKKKLDFSKLNRALTPELQKYIKSIRPNIESDMLGGFDTVNKILYVPVDYHPTLYQTLIHEVVHAIHLEDLKKLQIQGMEWMDYLKTEDLKDNYDDFSKHQYYKFLSDKINSSPFLQSAYFKFQDKNKYDTLYETYLAFVNSEEGKRFSYIFDKYKPISKEDWLKAKQLSSRITPHSDLYYATNQELLAYFENAVNLFSVDNLEEVYKKHFNDVDEYLKYLKSVFATIGFEKTEKGFIQFKGITKELRKLIELIVETTGDPHIGAINEVVDPKWWGQLAKQITNNFNLLENRLKFGQYED